MPLKLGKSDLDQYAQALRNEASNEVDFNNPQLLLFLSCITEPAMLLLLAKRNCPIRPLGSVNVRNRFELLRTDGKPTPLLEARDAVATASLHSDPRRVKRGLEYDVETTLTLGDPETGEQVPVFRQVFTMLQFMKHKQPPVPTAAQKTEKVFSSAMKLPVRLATDEPSRWATVSKDYNPIHIFDLAARMYGFPGKIAHGNHIVAKSLQAIAKRSQKSAHVLSRMDMPIWMEVSFKRPVTVPAQLEFCVIQRSDDHVLASFEISQRDNVCIEGGLGVLPSK